MSFCTLAHTQPDSQDTNFNYTYFDQNTFVRNYLHLTQKRSIDGPYKPIAFLRDFVEPE